MKVFAERVKKVRQARGMTIETLAACAEIDEWVAQKIEDYEANHSARVMVAVAQTLNVSLDYLCGLTDEEPELPFRECVCGETPTTLTAFSIGAGFVVHGDCPCEWAVIYDMGKEMEEAWNNAPRSKP